MRARIASEDNIGAVRDILIVDDNQMARETLVGMVEHAGYPAVACANPAGALARVAEQRPALILLDMMMPEIDGADFLRRLRQIDAGATVPVIVVSAIGHLLQGMRRSDVHSAGVAAVLSKPVPYATLIEAITRIIGPPDGSPPVREG
jgi:CheY-like chemotaxis protein